MDKYKTLELSDNLSVNIEKAFNIISSVHLYPEFVPGYKKVELLEKTEKYIKADITPSIPIKNIVMEAFLDFPYKIQFKQVKGPLDVFEGIWNLKETNVKHVIKVDFSLKYYVKNFLIRKLVYKFIKISFNDIITSFKIRSRQI